MTREQEQHTKTTVDHCGSLRITVGCTTRGMRPGAKHPTSVLTLADGHIGRNMQCDRETVQTREDRVLLARRVSMALGGMRDREGLRTEPDRPSGRINAYHQNYFKI
jgi:hypothetical protein